MEPSAQMQTTNPSFFEKLKNTSRRTKVIALTIVILIIALGLLIVLYSNAQKNSQDKQTVKTENLPNGVIAKIGDREIPERYLEYEKKFFPNNPTDEQKKMLIEKIADDEITLTEGKKEGFITDFPEGSDLSEEKYLERTNLVEEIKQKVDRSGNVISGRLVSIWFYNNTWVGPKGFEESKKFAYSKIKPLYDQVKSGAITVDQAGKLIADDTSLAEIDTVYKGNALVSFTFYKGKPATFWPGFNNLLWQTEVGEVTPLYLGGGALRDGKPSDELYIFAQIDQKSTNDNYDSYDDWLQKKKNNSTTVISNSLSSMIQNFQIIKPTYADDDGQNPNTGQSGTWTGRVKTPTGAGIPDVEAIIKSGCHYPGPGKRMRTNGNGRFDSGTDSQLACNCVPITLTADIPNMTCQSFHYQSIGNPVAEYDQDIICTPNPSPTPPPTPPPPPILRCNQPCQDDTFCSQTTGDNCSKCLPSTGGGKTCQPPPPPIQCNAVCTDDTFCASAVNGCTRCLPNPNNPAQRTCQQIPRCGNLCITPADCNGAQNGCTSCLPDQQNPTRNICQEQPKCGSACATSEYCTNAQDGCTACIQGASGATCGKCPAGQVYDAATKSCKCPNPGETMPHKVCDGDKCLDVNSCGVSTCGDDKACFAEEMCKCDGFDSVALEYPSAKPFIFDSFAKVEGTDMTKAFVESISFRMFEADKSNPNATSIIAQSQPYIPEIVSSTGSKVRYKARWTITPPQIKANKVYRVQADIKCKPKKRSTVAELPANQYQSRVLGLVKSAEAQQIQDPNEFGVAGDDLQLKTLNLIKKTSTDMCHTMTFEYNSGI